MREFWEDLSQEKVIGLDLDGVVFDYPKCWIDFVNKTRGTMFSDLFNMKSSISYKDYIYLKDEYRRSGYKEFIPINSGAREFTHMIREAGIKIIILTARPFDQYRNLMKITINSLDKNDISYDGLISGKDKHVKILIQVPHLKFMIEDHRSISNLVASWGYKVYLVNNQYNQGEIHSNVSRVDNLFEILKKEGIIGEKEEKKI